jgi:putative PIN family toxin of toxin-antitoxin system
MMADVRRLVLDTNVVVSGSVFSAGIPSRALLKAQGSLILASDATLLELVEVMNRLRFDRYAERSIRQGLVAEYMKRCAMAQIPTPIRACRDPRDDKFLEVAVHGRADLIVNGDRDLLDLHPFRGIAIFTPAAYIEMP